MPSIACDIWCLLFSNKMRIVIIYCSLFLYVSHSSLFLMMRFPVIFHVRDRAWFVRLYGEIIDCTGAQTMLYLTCTTITSVDLAHYGVSRDKDWVSMDCGTSPSKRLWKLC